MKLQSFRIQHFKSIKDTDWCNLSFDRITGLIGQNESGKSSILEALYAFYSGTIHFDAFRNDGEMPIIACSFVFTKENLNSWFDPETLPIGLVEFIDKNLRINIQASWIDNKTVHRQLEESLLQEIFKNSENTGVPNNAEEGQLEENTTPSKKTITQGDFINTIMQKIPPFQQYESNKSLLPNQIDLADIINANSKAEGYIGVMNFLTIANVNLEKLKGMSSPMQRKSIADSNKKITADFRDFWTQKIGKTYQIDVSFELKVYDDSTDKKGKYYLEFWVKDEEFLHPKQRSQGVRWFLSFYLQLKATKVKNNTDSSILLIDEPGESLHARAQEDVLKVFEDIQENIQVIYTTHSPYLVKLDWLYRLLAVQRSNENDENSETLVFDAQKLGAASSDTLTPLLTNMGIDVSYQNVIKDNNNVILEEPSAFFYLIAFAKLLKQSPKIYYLPATGADKVPVLVYLLTGWGIDHIVVLDNDSKGQKIYNDLKETLYGGVDDEAKKKIVLLKEGIQGIEDIFSASDFRKYILENSESYASKNSEYIKNARISKPISAAKFKNRVFEGSIKLEHLDKESQANIKHLLASIEKLLIQDKPKVDPVIVDEAKERISQKPSKE